MAFESIAEYIAKLIPTKRELKPLWSASFGVTASIAKLIPTKRELKPPIKPDTTF